MHEATQLQQLLLTEAKVPGAAAKTAMTAETKKSFMLVVCLMFSVLLWKNYGSAARGGGEVVRKIELMMKDACFLEKKSDKWR